MTPLETNDVQPETDFERALWRSVQAVKVGQALPSYAGRQIVKTVQRPSCAIALGFFLAVTGIVIYSAAKQR